MEMDQFMFGIILFVGQISSSVAADCSTNTPDVHTFGQECQYMCHCKNGDKCDKNTGKCSEACAANRFGPACQYRDLAEAQYSRHNSNQFLAQYSHEANDGDTSSCSYTQKYHSSIARPWWKVWFPQNETIRDVYILTEDNSRKYFPGFEVSVEYVPFKKKSDISYVPIYKHTCYEHGDTVPGKTNIHVQCDQPIVGNQVRIQLATKQSQLVLCDVRIGAGRNFAFRQTVAASEYNNISPPLNAVDGRAGATVSTTLADCFAASNSGNKYLDINLRNSIEAYSVDINTNNDEYIKDYQIYTASTAQTDLRLVYDDTGNIPPITNVHLKTNVKQLRIQTSNTDQLTICELEIYGECLATKCGYACTENCYCNSNEDYEHRISGVCTTGCRERWTGANGKWVSGDIGMTPDVVQTLSVGPMAFKCDESKWGTQCQNDCGACRLGTCDVVSGECTDGCQDGYQDTIDCITECQDGIYGEKCGSSCSEQCMNGNCNKTKGACIGGCKAGYIGDKCDQECNIGQYGINCAGSCGFCTVHTSCDTVTGVCPSGCMDGYTGATCKHDIEPPIQSNTIGIVDGSVVAIIVIICVTIVVVCVFMYRRRQSPPVITEPENRVEMSHAPTSASYEGFQRNVYMNDKEETNYETINTE